MKTVGSFMRPFREVLHPDHPLREAVRRLVDSNQTILPVCEGDEVIGILRAKDVRSRTLSSDTGYFTVRDAMSKEFYFCYDHDSVQFARDVMKTSRLDDLCVLNRRKELVGLLSVDDIAVYLLSEADRSGSGTHARRPRAKDLRARQVSMAGAAKEPDPSNGPPSYATRPKVRE